MRRFFPPSLALAFALGATVAFAASSMDQVTGLWTFQPGEPIRLDEVQENFDILGEHMALFEGVIRVTSGGDDYLNNGLVGLYGASDGKVALRIRGDATDGGVDIRPGAVDGPNKAASIQGTHYSDPSMPYDLSINPDGGNVGIGTTDPESRLDVRIDELGPYNSDDILASNQRGLRVGNESGDAVQIEFLTHDSSFITIGSTSEATRSAIVFGTSNTSGKVEERVRINREGQVGIGTTNPSAALDVVGHLRLRNTSYSDSECAPDRPEFRGRITYVTTTDAFYGCTASGWVRLDIQ